MRRIIVVGAGGFGREILMWVKDINAVNLTWEIAGFIDDNPAALDGVACDYGVVGSIQDWRPQNDEDFVLALGDPKTKEKVALMLKARGAHFPPIIHPTAIVSEFSHYGEGFVAFPYAKLSVNSTVGEFVSLLSSGVGHDVYIGDYTTVSGACNILRNVKIGQRVFLAAGVSLAQGINVDDNAYIGLGSVVINDVPKGAKMFGNPARRLLG